MNTTPITGVTKTYINMYVTQCIYIIWNILLYYDYEFWLNSYHKSVMSSSSSRKTMFAHWTRTTVSLLKCTSALISPNPTAVNYNICAEMEQRVYLRKCTRSRNRHYGIASTALSKSSLITQMMSGANVTERATCVHVKALKIKF